jgi:hypothetical protein
VSASATNLICSLPFGSSGSAFARSNGRQGGTPPALSARKRAAGEEAYTHAGRQASGGASSKSSFTSQLQLSRSEAFNALPAK